MSGGWPGGRASGCRASFIELSGGRSQKHTRENKEKMGRSWLPFGEAMRRAFICRHETVGIRTFTNWGHRKRVKGENEGGDVFPATDPPRRCSKKSRVRRGENLLNRCEVGDVECEDGTVQRGRRNTSKRLKRKVWNREQNVYYNERI
jgi:hypothetical protein